MRTINLLLYYLIRFGAFANSPNAPSVFALKVGDTPLYRPQFDKFSDHKSLKYMFDYKDLNEGREDGLSKGL